MMKLFIFINDYCIYIFLDPIVTYSDRIMYGNHKHEAQVAQKGPMYQFFLRTTKNDIGHCFKPIPRGLPIKFMKALR